MLSLNKSANSQSKPKAEQTEQTNSSCKFWGFRSNMLEESVLLGHDVASCVTSSWRSGELQHPQNAENQS
jgi:hypothetical protein